MKKYKLKNLALIIMFILSLNVYAQVEYGITTTIGRNNFTYDSWMYYEYWDGERKEVYIWAKVPQANLGTGLGGYFRFSFKNLPVGFEINPEIQTLRSKLYHKTNKTFENNQLERLYLPLKIYARLNSRLRLYGGLDYSYAFNFKKLKIVEATTYASNWGYLSGIDYQILNCFSLGAYYYNSYHFDFETPAYKLGFTASGIAIKLSYNLSSINRNL